MQIALALDLATRTGWAFGAPGTQPQWGVFALPLKTGENIGSFLAAFEDRLLSLLDFCSPDRVIFESPILRRATNLATLRKLYSLAGLTELICLRLKLPVSEAPLPLIRKHFINHGSMRSEQAKQAVMDQCVQRGWPVTDNNEGDALAVWDYACSLMDPSHSVAGLPLMREGSRNDEQLAR